MAASYPTSTPSDASLYVAVDNFGTTLDGAIDDVQTTITLTSVVGLPSVGILTIDSEKVHYTGISSNDITGVTRGFSSTTASAHLNGAGVFLNVVEEHHNGVKDEIIAVATDLRSAITADLDDSVSPALTAGSLKVRLDHIATQLKEINTGTDWKDAVAKRLTDLVALDGTRTMTGNLPMGGFKLTGLSAGTTAGDSVRYEQAILTDGANAFTANQPMGGFKLTGLGAGTTAGDSLRYEQVVGVYALDSAVVHNTGSETVAGAKTFSSLLTISAATNPSLSNNVSLTSDELTWTLRNADNTSGTSNARLNVQTGGASGGDPYTRYGTAVTDFSWGVDNSDSDAMCLTNSSTLNGTNLIRATNSGGVQEKGTTTNDSAASGFKGEYVASTQTTFQNAVTTGQFFDITSISLTAGDWDISAVSEFNLNGATLGPSGQATAISVNSGNTTSDHVANLNVVDNAGPDPTAAQNRNAQIPSYRLSLSGSTTVYLKGYFTFSAGTPRARGRISARRVR